MAMEALKGQSESKKRVNMERLSVLLLIVVQSCCTGQKKMNSKESTDMTQKREAFEKKTFDIETFDKNKNSELNQYNFYNNEGDYISRSEYHDVYIETIEKADSKFNDYIVYFKNGRIKELGFLFGEFLIGEYTYYDKDGDVIKTKNYDRHYTFTLEDVLRYCKEHKLEERETSEFNRKVTVTLNRTDASELSADDPVYWYIMYGLVPYTPQGSNRAFATVLRTTLDGRTGKEIKKEYKRAKIDKEWHPMDKD